jgi:hypothetical protein
MLDANDVVRVVDRDQEGRVDVLAAPHEVGVGVHARGEVFEHVLSPVIPALSLIVIIRESG